MSSVTTRHLFGLLSLASSTRREFSRERGQRRGTFPVSAASARGAGWGFFLSGVALLILFVLFGFFYIRQITASAVGGYDVGSLERRVNELKEKEQVLDLQAAELQSLKRIEENVQRLNLLRTESVAFTSPLVRGPVAFTGLSDEL